MARVAFSKYHGLGNDFLIVDRRSGGPPMDRATAVRLCDRHRGVGADGVLSVLPPTAPGAELRMHIHNADGSEPETCGNGIRCFAFWAARQLPEVAARGVLAVETGAGVARAELVAVDDAVGEVRVSMGRPRLEAGEIALAAPLPRAGRVVDAPLEALGRRLSLTAVSMGNPHAVLFDGPGADEAAEVGPALEHHPAFPEGVNVGFARVRGPGALDLTVWERGCGITEACGSGACAAAVAGVVTGRLEAGREVEVRLPGGVLRVEVAPDLSDVLMTGPAEWVYDGELDLARFREDR